ncbi:Trypsin epsilon [Orchesella cincta]|uniref:Trypsin epsilon n=1 Tax=Orchesella cincta TaxID=48709 RepID=A0A1D2M7H0_ORCCI|nr:Trypsin epsilon [Orchesella cincta]
MATTISAANPLCDFAYDGDQCPYGMNELYRVVTDGRVTQRGCCSPRAGDKEKMEIKAVAEGCSTSTCIPKYMKNACATLPNYTVNNTQLTWEQVYEEDCAVYDPDGQPFEGHLGYCCHPDSLEGALVSTFGAEVNEFPHQAAVSVDGGVCGGTIYNKRYVITAAHCVVNPATRRLTPINQGKGYKITIGRNMWSNGGPQNVFGVENVTVHEGYSKKLGSKELKKIKEEGLKEDMLRTYNDIALLRLNRDIEFGPNVKALRLADKDFNPLKFAKTAMIVGWGTTESGRVVGHLQKANFQIRTDQRCFQLKNYQRFWELKDKLLCLGGIVDGQWSPGTGSGDSGGPAICRGDKKGTPVLCGITSFSIGGIECIKNQNENSCYPSVFAEVGNFKSWVEEKIPEKQSKLNKETELMNQPVYGVPTSAPHQVQVTSSTGKSCGGTLIKPDVVITAAHCVMYDDSSLQRGIKVKTSQGQTFELSGSPALLTGFRKIPKPRIPAEREKPKRVIMPDNFYANDMAILLLKGKVQGVNFPRLPERNEKPRGPILELARQ